MSVLSKNAIPTIYSFLPSCSVRETIHQLCLHYGMAPGSALCSSLYTLLLSCAASAERAYLTLLVLGLAGALPRSDFGLYPFALFAATLLLYVFFSDQAQKQAILNAFFGLVGATLGVALIFVHNQLFTGNPIQSRVDEGALVTN